MIISESWLREWVSPRIDSEQLMRRLTDVGLEVGSVERAGPSLDGVVIGRIESVDPHPDADRLRVCKVDIGSAKPVDIVCGAPNAAADLGVVVATPGSSLPGDVKIKKTTIRGVESTGMICSASELGLAEERSAGIIELPTDVTPGEAFDRYFNLDDNIIEIELTPNRGDCMSIRGVAREVAAATKSKLKEPKIESIRAVTKRRIDVSLKSSANCPRYVGRIIDGVRPDATTPWWLAERLRRSGLRPISPIVDVTNYVMIELGQPMHAFDFDRLVGNIIVRQATDGEPLKLLDGSEITLGSDNLVIADEERAIALAGIMGGDSTSISDSTTTLFLESAFFSPEAIVGRGRQFGLLTDAGQRFERGVDPGIQRVAIERATALLLSIVGGNAGPVVDAIDRPAMPKKKSVTLRAERLTRIIGHEYERAAVSGVLTRLGMKANEIKSGWRVRPPAFRFDVNHEHDLVEEVARVIGFDVVVPRRPSVEASTTIHEEGELDRQQIDSCLVERGYREVMSYSFVDPELQQALVPDVRAIALANPIASNMAHMRVSLLPGLVQALVTNLNRQHRRIRLYEGGVVFSGDLKNRTEEFKIAGIATGFASTPHFANNDREMDFYDIKGDLEALLVQKNANSSGVLDERFRFEATDESYLSLHPGQSATVFFEDKAVGVIGQLHPTTAQQLDIDHPVYLFEIAFSALQSGGIPNYSPISKFPTTRRDISVLVDETTPVGNVRTAIEQSTGELLINLEIFDIYRGENIETGRKSVSFGLTLQDSSRTLADSDIEQTIDQLLKTLAKDLGATLRD